MAYPVNAESRKVPSKDGAFLCLSYIVGGFHAQSMTRESKWKSRAIALEYWLLSALVAGSFIAGLVSAIRMLAVD